MEFKVDCCNVLNIVKTIAILLIAYFLGYISAHLTNKQIEEYCFNYNMIKAYNYGIEIFSKVAGGSRNPLEVPLVAGGSRNPLEVPLVAGGSRNPLEVPTLNNFSYHHIYVNISTK